MNVTVLCPNGVFITHGWRGVSEIEGGIGGGGGDFVTYSYGVRGEGANIF